MPDITRAQFLAGYNALTAVKASLTDTEYRWTAAGIRVALSADALPLIEERDDLAARTADKYTEERIGLCLRLARRTTEGQPMYVMGRFDIDPAKQVEFDEAHRALLGKHADAIAAEEKAKADLRSFLRVKMPVPATAKKLQREWFDKKTTDQDLLEALLHIGVVAE